MVSLLYFFLIKLGYFQPVEAMHQPVASPAFGLGGKTMAVSTGREIASTGRMLVCNRQPLTILGLAPRNDQCLPVEFPGQPVEYNRSTDYYLIQQGELCLPACMNYRTIGKVGFYDEKTMCKVFSNHYLFLGLSYDPTFVLQTYGAIEVHEIWLFIKSYLQVLNGAPKLW